MLCPAAWANIPPHSRSVLRIPINVCNHFEHLKTLCLQTGSHQTTMTRYHVALLFQNRFFTGSLTSTAVDLYRRVVAQPEHAPAVACIRFQSLDSPDFPLRLTKSSALHSQELVTDLHGKDKRWLVNRLATASYCIGQIRIQTTFPSRTARNTVLYPLSFILQDLDKCSSLWKDAMKRYCAKFWQCSLSISRVARQRFENFPRVCGLVFR